MGPGDQGVWKVAIFTAKSTFLRECTSFEPFCIKIGWAVWPPGVSREKSQKVLDSHRNDVPVISGPLMFKAKSSKNFLSPKTFQITTFQVTEDQHVRKVAIFTAWCTLVQSAVLRSHVVCLSLCLSASLVYCDHINWNSSEIISPLVCLGCSLSADPNIRGLLQGEHLEILAQSDPSPCWFEHRRHSITNCGWMVTDSATVTMESL